MSSILHCQFSASSSVVKLRSVILPRFAKQCLDKKLTRRIFYVRNGSSISNDTARRCVVGIAACLGLATAVPASYASDTLVGRAVLPAATFAEGPTSGQQLGADPINGQSVPFINKQPVQGFSAIRDNGDGTFWVMADNGYGAIENSADFNLRVYKIRPQFKTKKAVAAGSISKASSNFMIPTITFPSPSPMNSRRRRVLTGADFDIESMQKAKDGTLWFGDEFGPFLLHTDTKGKVLEAPIPLPDFDNPGKEVRSPQNPFSEEATAVRIMNAVRSHAKSHGSNKTPVFSPWEVMLDDGNPNTFIDNRKEPPPGSGLKPASSEIFNVTSIKNAGYPVVTWTVNTKARMLELMKLGVNGIISDRPDLLREARQGI